MVYQSVLKDYWKKMYMYYNEITVAATLICHIYHYYMFWMVQKCKLYIPDWLFISGLRLEPFAICKKVLSYYLIKIITCSFLEQMLWDRLLYFAFCMYCATIFTEMPKLCAKTNMIFVSVASQTLFENQIQNFCITNISFIFLFNPFNFYKINNNKKT